MKILHEDNFTQIRHDPDQNCIEWEVKSFVPSMELMEFFEKVYNYTNEYNCTKNLVDMTKMGVIPEDVQDWFQESWFPRMIQIGVKQFALVNSKSVITKMSVNKMDKDIEDMKEKFGITTEYFDNINDAKTFLASSK